MQHLSSQPAGLQPGQRHLLAASVCAISRFVPKSINAVINDSNVLEFMNFLNPILMSVWYSVFCCKNNNYYM
jgi:hypothetical protein